MWRFPGVGIFEAPLQKLMERVGFSFQRLLYTHLATGEKSVSAQQTFALRALASQARKDALDYPLLCGPRQRQLDTGPAAVIRWLRRPVRQPRIRV